MTEPEGFRLFSVRAPIIAAAEKLTELALDHAITCDHRFASFICGRHPHVGVLCMSCMSDHQNAHTPLDNECNCCEVVRPVTTGVLPTEGAGLVVVVRLCEECQRLPPSSQDAL